VRSENLTARELDKKTLPRDFCGILETNQHTDKAAASCEGNLQEKEKYEGGDRFDKS
jgi:hypothetical protein